jgi:hypothetical protein
MLPPARLECPSLAVSLVAALVVFMTAATAPPALAQWPSNPAVNLAIADLPAEQAIPKVATILYGDYLGGAYVGWFDQSTGNYDVRLQLLDREGNEMWPHNGIVVSAHPQNSWLVDWDLINHYDGSAVLVFADARGGSDFDIHAYMIDENGQFVWGPDGVTLSTNDDFEAAPRVASVSSNHLAVVWQRSPDGGDGSIMMQRLSAAGVELLPHGGVPIVTVPGETPAFPAIATPIYCPGAPGDARSNEVYVSWVRDITTFASPRHVRVGLFDDAGALVWGNHVNVFDQISVPIAYTPQMVSGCGGDAMLAWHWSDGMRFHTAVQRVGDDGDEYYPHNGIEVSTNASRNHMAPALTFGQYSGIIVFWMEENLSQSQWGLWAQKLGAGRMWGDTGVELLPVDNVFKYSLTGFAYSTGAIACLLDEPTGHYGENRVLALRVDGTGSHLWTTVVSSTLSEKTKLRSARTPTGSAGVMVWGDDRAGTFDIYGQNIIYDGSIGPPPTTSAGDAAAPALATLAQNRPNPFRTSTDFVVTADQALRRAHIVVFDAAGRQVQRLPVGSLVAGQHVLAWNGRSPDGVSLPSGVYFYQLTHEGGASGMRKAILLR